MMMCQIEVENLVEGGCRKGLYSRSRKADGTSRGAGHQMSFCKTEINWESDDGIGSIYQNKVDSLLNSDSKDKEGVWVRLAEKKVISLRDTGCTGCVIRRILISDDQLIG